MKSRMAEALGLKKEPVAILWTDDRPPLAKEFKKGKWGCVMWLFTAASQGKSAVVSADTYGCWGGGVGLGFGNQYLNFPSGMEGFCRFLSTGNAGWDKGLETARQMEAYVSKEFLEDYLRGEGYLKTPVLVEDFVKTLPMTQVPSRYVLFKPLSEISSEGDPPRVVVFLADPDQLSALVILANYGRSGNENVIIPYAAGCQTIGIYPYREAESSSPRAVVGLTDISARLHLKRQLGGNFFSFSIPWRMFLEMEEDVKGSFLTRRTWRDLRGES